MGVKTAPKSGLWNEFYLCSFPGHGGGNPCCMGNAGGWRGILRMYSEDQGMFFQLPLLPTPNVVLWTPCHYSQAQKETLQSVFLVRFLLCKVLSSVLVCPYSALLFDAICSALFSPARGAIISEETDIQRGEETPRDWTDGNNETRL